MEAAEKPLIMKKNTCDREMAIQEITRGYELIKQIRSISFLGSETQSELHGVLFEEALQTLTMAMTNLKSRTSPKSVEASCVSLNDHGSEGSNEIKTLPSGSRKRALKADNTWTKVTYAPHDDGHQWRKYGQKIIKKSKLSRSYYRCTYKDEGCLARKHVQQKDCNDPPLFSVTYYETHTCTCNNYPLISPQMTLNTLVPIEPNLFSFESNSNVFSQEDTVLDSSFKESTTQQDSEEESVGLQNKTIDQESLKSVANSDQDCQQAMVNNCVEGIIPTGPCSPPSWELMCMDYLKESSFGSDDDFFLF